MNTIKKTIQRFRELFPGVNINTINYKEGQEHYSVDINDYLICKVSKKVHNMPLEHEVKILTLLYQRLKTSIPEIQYYEPGFLVYKKITGVALTPAWYESLDQEERKSLAADIAFFLYELHTIVSKNEGLGLGFGETDWPLSPEVLQQEMSIFDDVLIGDIFQLILPEYIFLRTQKKCAVLHNDLTIHNIIINTSTKKLSGIIDFTDVVVDDVYLDLRLNYTSIPELSEAIAHHYSLLTGVPIDVKNIYVYYLATELSRYCQQIKNECNQLSVTKERIKKAFNRYAELMTRR